MGRNRIEDQFKEKLIHREIAPSAGSWEKLSGQLNSEKKKGKPIIWWIGIAATLIGAIFISGLIYNNNYQPDNAPIVETPTKEIKELPTITEPAESKKGVSERIANENKIFKEKPSSGRNKSTTILKPKTDAGLVENAPFPIISDKTSNMQITSTVTPVQKEETIEQEVSKIMGNDPAIASEMNIIMAEIAQLERNNGKIEDAEINALLSKAATQISKHRQERLASEKIDAEALLWDVEMDMEDSFREKIFEVMKEGYLKARTAVVNRNN